jgi:aminoglycoside phosphotransferase (APT) family kinase protein
MLGASQGDRATRGCQDDGPSAGRERSRARVAVACAAMETPPGIHLENVTRFFRDEVPGGDAPLRFELIGGGRSNLTYRVTMGERSVALRRPPLGHVLPTAHDMRREFRVLRALADSDVPVPRPIALCEDPAVLDHPFYVMEYRPGVVLQGATLPEGYLADERDRARASRALVDTLVTLHAVDPRAVGLEDFGRPDGYLARQLRRWEKQWQANRTAPLPEIDELLARLARALPEHSDAALVHGDYRLGNLALDPEDPGCVVAIYDWEMATLGDPLADLGYTLIYWMEASDPPSAIAEVGAVTARPGFFTRSELARAYAEASGRDLGQIDFYQVLALTKLAVISEGIYKRFQLGKTAGAAFDRVSRAALPLAERALAIANASHDTRLR